MKIPKEYERMADFLYERMADFLYERMADFLVERNLVNAFVKWKREVERRRNRFL
jgi:hypothetical protein